MSLHIGKLPILKFVANEMIINDLVQTANMWIIIITAIMANLLGFFLLEVEFHTWKDFMCKNVYHGILYICTGS